MVTICESLAVSKWLLKIIFNTMQNMTLSLTPQSGEQSDFTGEYFLF